MLNIFSTGEKIYIESETNGCVARLCKVSAELYSDSKIGESRLEEYVLNCPFEKFQEIVKHKYGIEIDDEHRPDWSVNVLGDLEKNSPRQETQNNVIFLGDGIR